LQSLYRNLWNAEQGTDEAFFPSDEKVETGGSPRERLTGIVKKIALIARIPIPRTEWVRLILSLQFRSAVAKLVPILVDRTKRWHPLWLNTYLFNRGRGKNIRCIATYNASGRIRLRRSSRRSV